MWVIHHGMTLEVRDIVYRDWKKCASAGEVSSILVAIYQAAWQGWDFTKATTCIFVQQPWLAEY